MSKSSAFVPGHISGFFQVCNEFDDPARKGSRNCGPCIGAGVATEVEAKESSSSRIEIFINDEEAPGALTSRKVVGEILKILDKPFKIKINHRVRAPIGAGYGTSGAGAIGAALALSRALKLGLDRSKVFSLAHKAEVLSGTGLGDVGPQMRGGLIVSLEPGCFPHGKLKEIGITKDMSIICGTLGPFSTSELLNDPEFRNRSKKAGSRALKDFLADESIKNFMKVSREFVSELGILDEELMEILDAVSSECPWGAGVVMLGRAIFAPARSSESEEVRKGFLDYFDQKSVMVPKVDFEGARIST